MKDLNRDRLLDEVATQLHSAMVTRDVAKAELARRMGIKPPSINKMLGGSNNFRLETLADLFFELDLAVHITTSNEVGRVFQPSGTSCKPCELVVFQSYQLPCLSEGEWSAGDTLSTASADTQQIPVERCSPSEALAHAEQAMGIGFPAVPPAGYSLEAGTQNTKWRIPEMMQKLAL